MLRAEDIVDEPLPDLPHHTLDLFDRLLQLSSNLRSHALEVNVVALCHISHSGRGVNVRAVGSDGVNGRLHDLLNQSKALILSSGQKYRLFSLSSGSLCRLRRSSRQNDGNTNFGGRRLRVWVEVRDEHEVNGRAVVDGLQASTCVEVTHGVTGLVGPGRGLR